MLTGSVLNYKRVSEKANSVTQQRSEERRNKVDNAVQQAVQPAAPTQQPPKGLAAGMLFQDRLTQSRVNDSLVEARKPAAQKLKEAQTLYDAYVQSDEYRQNLNAQTDSWMMAALGGNAEPMRPAGDQKEQELKALVDHYTAQVQQEEIQATTDAALRELEGWSEEDRKALEAYWVQDAWERQHPIADPITGDRLRVSKTVAADLIAKYGEETVNRIAEALEWKYSSEETEKFAQAGREAAGDSFFDGIGADIVSIGAKGLGNLTGMMSYVMELGRRTGQYPTLNPNNIGNIPNVYGSAIQSQKAENIAADGGLLDKGAAYLYQGGMSVADNALRMAMGGGATGGAILAATGSFAQAVSEASAQGATPGEAVLNATITAGIEAATEKIPLDNLMDAAKAGGHAAKDIIKNALIQGGIEATTEEISLIGSTLAEAAILKEKAGYQQRVNELIAGGSTPEGAIRQADNELLKEAMDTAIVSALSGGLSEAGASVAGNLTHRAADPGVNAAEMQQNPESAAKVQQEAVQVDPEAAPTLEDVAEQLGKDAPKAEPVQKTEQEITLDRAMRETFGQKGNDFGSRAADLERAQAQEESAEDATVGGEYEFSNIARANYAINELRESDDWKSMSQAQRVNAINEIMDYYTKVVDETAHGIAPEHIKQTQKNAASKETTVTVKSAKTALTEENKAKNTLAYTLASNLGAVRDMQPVAQLTGKEFNDRSVKLSDQIRGFFKKLGNKVSRNGFGEVELGEYGVGGMLNHKPLNRAKVLSVAAVPDVIRNGRQINYDPNWKDRGYESYTFAGPATVNGTTVYVAAVVNKHPDNKFYLSEMVDSEGNYVRIEESPSGNSKNGLPMGPENQQGRDYAGPEELSKGSNPSTEAEPMPLSENIVPQQKKEVNGNIDESRAQVVDGQTQSTEGGQVPNGKSAYETVMENGNTQPDRADDVRKMAMPETDINGRDVSAVAGDVYASKITPDDFAELMKEPAAKGKLSYAKITNDQAVEWAKENIMLAGNWKTAYTEWSKQVARGTAGAEMSARGALLLNHAAREGDKDSWQDILLDVQNLGTNTAQGLQAYKILRSLDPESKLEMTEKVIRRMVDEMRLGTEITVDEALLEKFRKAETDEDRDAIMTEIQQNVADQIPSTFLDKFTALRYMNMLGNLKTTLARNTVGNLAMKGVYKIKDSVAAGVEVLLHEVSGGKFQKTKSLTVSSELREACKADFAQYAGIVSDGGKYGDSRTAAGDFANGVMEKRRIFKGDVRTGNEKFDKAANKVIDTALTPMEWYRKGTNWAMNNKYFGDEAFGRGAYARAMAGYLKANGVKDADLSKVDDALLDKARAYAIQEAQEATFHDNTMLARIVQRGQKAAGIVGEGIMPFTKTPANILVRAEEFSPLGLINSTAKSLQSAAGNTKLTEKNGRLGQWAKAGREITGADIVNSWAKTFTGTALFALGWFMKDQGWLTASADDDEDKAAFDKLNGEQEYAIVLPDGTNYTLDWLGPSVMPMFMGAELAQAIEEAGGLDELTWADWENILTSVSDPMLQMSMLSGINDTLDNIKYSDNSLVQLCINAAVSYLTQGLGNTLLGQMEKSTEEVRTQTYIDKDSQVPAWMQKQLGSLSQKIPGWDYQQTPYIDARGQEQVQPTGLGGWLYNLVSPGYLDQKEVDSVSEELYRLNETGATESNVFLDSPSTTFSYTDKDGVKHDDYNLSAKEAETLKRSVGKTSVDVLQALFETDTYKAMTDQQKTDALKYVDDYAREKGRTEAVEGYEGMSEWMLGIESKEAETIINRTVEAAFSDAFSLADRDPAAAAEALDQAYSLLDPNGRLAWAQEAGSKEEAFIMAKARKIDTQTFTGLYQQYKDIGKDEGLDNSQKAQEWADVLQKAQEAGDLTKAQKEGLKKDLIFYNQIPTSSAKYDTMTNQGMDSDSADYIVGLLDGIEATADKLDKIAGAKLPEEQKDIAMKAWMDDYDPKAKKVDYTEVKYDYIRKELGYSATDYSAAKRLYSSDGKKEDKIDRIEDKLGITDAQARELYGILDGDKNAMLKDWAEELYG